MANSDDNVIDIRRKQIMAQGNAPPSEDTEYFNHFRSTYRFTGYPFSSYLSAYRYAEQQGDEWLRGKEWQEVEGEFYRDWERSHPGTWSRYRDAIYYGWHRYYKR